jgi:hypothetical protein
VNGAITIVVELRPAPELLAAIDGLASAVQLYARALTTEAIKRDLGSIDGDPIELPVVVTPEPSAVLQMPDAPAVLVKSAHLGPQVTPERGALLDILYPAGVAIAAIAKQFNALPGPAVSNGGIAARASSRGLRRPVGFDHTTAPVTLADAFRMYSASATTLVVEAPQAPPDEPQPEIVARQPGDWLTPERRAELERRIKAGEYPSLYHPAIAAMPGPECPNRGKMQARAIALGIRWEPPAKAPTPRPNLGPNRLAAALRMPEQQIDTTTPIVTDFETIRARAAVWGIQMETRADLATVNAKARAIGHRPFQFEARP